MSSGQTVIAYNGVRLLNVVTQTFDQQAVFDPSGTDLMYHRFTIRVMGYVTGVDLRTTSPVPQPTANGAVLEALGIYDHKNPTIEEVALRSRLMEPRHDFQMWEGCNSSGEIPTHGVSSTARPLLIGYAYRSADPDSEFKKLSPDVGSPVGIQPPPFVPESGEPLSSAQADWGGYDINNGPRCLECTVSQIIANTLFRVEATFEISKVECDERGQATQNTKGVLSNRWSVSDSIDLNRNTTRTISGQIRVTTPRLNANNFRGWVIPSLQAGFKRESVQLTVTPDGLWLNYSIVDKEIHYSAPQPATSWDYKYTESVANGMTLTTAVDVTLRGKRDVDKKQLILLAVAIAEARVFSLLTGIVAVIDELTIIDGYNDNDSWVSLYVRATKVKENTELRGIGVLLPGKSIEVGDFLANPSMAGQPALNYDRNKSLGSYAADPIEIAGSLPIVSAWTAYLQSPCDTIHDTANITKTPSIDLVGMDTFPKRLDYTLGVTVATTLPSTPTTYISTAHRTNPYTHWQMDTTISEDRLRVQLPVAASVSVSGVVGTAIGSVVCALSQGVTKRIVRAKGTRIGVSPELPKLLDYCAGVFGGIAASGFAPSGVPPTTLLDSTVKADTPERTVDGKLIYTLAAELIYAVPASVIDFATGAMGAFRIGHNPWENTSASSTVYTAGPPATGVVAP